jgi:hypothetical protein
MPRPRTLIDTTGAVSSLASLHPGTVLIVVMPVFEVSAA